MTIVVTGATGSIGRPLVNNLHAAGVAVRAVTRHPDTAGFPSGVSVVDTVAAALPDASAMFLNSRALGDELVDVVAQARRHGVSRLVALSALNADDDFSLQASRALGDRNTEVEQLAVDSGLQWVSLRPSGFASWVGRMWVAQIQTGDTVSGPYAAASMAPITEGDIAAVAARAFLTDELVGRKVTLTGPQALTNAGLVEVIGAVLGRPLRYEEVAVEQVRQSFTDTGISPEFADAYMAMMSSMADKPGVVTTEVENILGRPAVSWRQWVSENQALFTK